MIPTSTHMSVMTEFFGYAVLSADDETPPPISSLVSWDQVRVHPTRDAADRSRRYGLFGRDVWKVKLTLPEGAYFAVQGDQDMSAGMGGWRPVGQYLDYWMAYEAARGEGAQHSWGYIKIMVPTLAKTVVKGLDHEAVVLSESLTYTISRIGEHVEFLELATN